MEGVINENVLYNDSLSPFSVWAAVFGIVGKGVRGGAYVLGGVVSGGCDWDGGGIEGSYISH